jgi:hypothetical protein
VGRTRSCERLSRWSRSPSWLLWTCTRSGRSSSRCTCGLSIRYGTLDKVWHSWMHAVNIVLLTLLFYIFHESNLQCQSALGKLQTRHLWKRQIINYILAVWRFGKSSSQCICASVNKAALGHCEQIVLWNNCADRRSSICGETFVCVDRRSCLSMRSSGVRFVVTAGRVFFLHCKSATLSMHRNQRVCANVEWLWMLRGPLCFLCLAETERFQSLLNVDCWI